MCISLLTSVLLLYAGNVMFVYGGFVRGLRNAGREDGINGWDWEGKDERGRARHAHAFALLAHAHATRTRTHRPRSLSSLALP